MARLEGGGGSLTIEDVSVSQLFKRVAARHERACQVRRLTIAPSIEPGADVVAGNRDRLEQALQTPRGRRYSLCASRLDDSARPAGGVAISVEDEGPGIAPEHLPHIFDRSYKAEASRTGNSGGSGLGLSIVKAIVERHGARISVSSRQERTTFEIVFPTRN